MTGDQSCPHLSTALSTPLLSAKLHVNKHVNPQNAVTISPKLAQS
jgi:hypothetical protein